jgi:hypothetical protein
MKYSISVYLPAFKQEGQGGFVVDPAGLNSSEVFVVEGPASASVYIDKSA